MQIGRRQFMAGLATTTLLGSIGRAGAQSTTLSAPWMGWPEEQVAPLMAAFEKETGIKVAAERLPIAELFKTLEVRLQARNEIPDVYLVDGPLTASYAARGHLLVLDEMLADDLERFLPSTLVQGTYDEKLYAMPLGTSTQILFYNKKLFAEAGLPEPSADPAKRMTWEEALSIAQALTKPEISQFGIAFENCNPYQLLALPQSWGAEVIGPDQLTAAGYVNGDAMVDAMTWYQELHQTHKVAPVGTFQTGVTQEMFGSGKLAMIVGGTWNLVGFEKFEGLDFGVAPHPYFAKGTPVTPTGSWHIGINPRTAHMEEAKAFVRWLSTRDAMDLWFELRQYPPSLRQIWEERASTNFIDPVWEIVQHELEHTATPRPATPGYREYEDFLKTAMQDINTGADVRATLDRAAQNIDREMRKYR
ncbi:sugar ABC transporter substrate-binding protein [Aerobium aerolatum]|uniref:Multiple sugar transport system substrate-binding protein n=1 Tax=Aquamicrobium aerolatum DSM 21857 TaxID=1121003 RepID=A0A1I3HEU3_9HYPH|nr:sugar ABC transporter substrate-binding protein [Aquamicrobium aerolatum]SFI34192.1 multiple sugar transport system substrate-binding protein [Aquamicrobium aerolatum DSM 21857]